MGKKVCFWFGGLGLLILILSLVDSGLILFARDAFAQQKPMVIRYSHYSPEVQPTALQARFFEKCVKEKSNGRIAIEVYPAAQLFSMRDVFPAIRKGAVEMGPPAVATIQGSIPLMEIFDLPFLFQSYDQVTRTWQGYPGEIFRKDLENLGIKVLAEGYFNFLAVSNSKREIRAPRDIKGLKIRVMGPMQADSAKAMGAGPVAMGGDEVYLALSRKTVDGAFTGLTSMTSRKYWEVQKYVTQFALGITDTPVCMNLQFWNGLSKEDQNLLLQCGKESQDYVVKETIRQEEEAVGILKKNGMAYYEPTAAEMDVFRKATASIIDAWIKKNGEVAAKMVKFVESVR